MSEISRRQLLTLGSGAALLAASLLALEPIDPPSEDTP